MAKKQKGLSHEEIWDDSGLIKSWDESYEEYKRYHSIAARGERLEDVLGVAESPDESTLNGSGSAVNKRRRSSQKFAEAAEEGKLQADESLLDVSNGVSKEPNDQHMDTESASEVDLKGGQPVPQVMVETSTADPALKNLMMSWYWAGYYSGFYEGQRQGKMISTNQAT